MTVIIIMSAMAGKAQFYNGMNMSFGKNRVQWKDFNWSYYRTDNFDVYYYQGGDELAQYVRRYATSEIPLLERKMSNHFTKKVQFIVFNNLSDLKQSNINSEDVEEHNTGGVTRVIGAKVILYFDGDYVHFERQLREGVAQLLLSQVLNGTSIGSQIRNSYRYAVPEWFQNGLCAYVANDWDSYSEDLLQIGILSGKYEKINKLRGEDARIAGYSFWRFIEEQYDASAVNDVLSLSASTQNVKKSLLYVTGKPFKELAKQWYSFQSERCKTLLQKTPDELLRLKYRKYRSFTEPQISPDGQRIAYVSNDEGKIGIWIEDLTSGKRKRLFRSGYRSDEYIDTSFPLLAWHPRGDILSFIIEDKGQILLYNLDVESGETGQTNLFEFQKITSFSYAHKQRKIVLSATRNGKPDIFVYNLFSNTVEQITDDYFTDNSPVFSADDRQIIFSSNRSTDTAAPIVQPNVQGSQYDIFAFDYATKNPVMQNLTRQHVSNNIKPEVFPDGSMLYLSDTNGFYNLYEAIPDSAISYIDTTIHYRYFTHTNRITDYSTSIVSYSYNPKERKIAMLLPGKAGERVFLTRQQSGNQDVNIQQMNGFAQRRIIDEYGRTHEDTLKTISSHRLKGSFKTSPKAGQNGNNIQNKTLESLAREPDRVKDTVLRPNNYYVELFPDKLISQIDFTELNCSYQPFTGGYAPVYLYSGLNIFLGATLCDLMKDYRIDLGVKLNTSLINNEYILKFSNLRKRLDKTLTLHRFVTDNYQTYYYRTFTDEMFYTLSYPFSEILSIRGTAIYRNDYQVSLAIDNVSLSEKNSMENWVGLRGELVYDNSRKLETNIYTGSRGKMFCEYHQLVARQTSNLIVVGFDYRKYTRIHRNFIWANRIAGSNSFGKNKLIYYMGGVDNWILARFDTGTPIDYTQNYAYQTLATNMRGFKQNIRNGNSFLVCNSELRFPIFSYLSGTPINSSFIRDFQIVAFGDLGTAWNGWNPFDPDNSYYTTVINDGNLHINVTEQKNPFVGGIGFGLRTSLFGYFIRGDMAWGIENGVVRKNPQFYLSFNLDF